MSGVSQRLLVPWGEAERQLPPHLNLYDQQPLAPYDPPAGSSAIPDDDGDEENVFRDMTFEEILEDLNARFLVNLPEEELTLVRLYWQAEQAHWFYEDYLRPLNPQLPALSQRHFTQLIIASSPMYADWDIDYDAVWAEYCAYKKMVPCCGGILLNQHGDKVLMVRGWKANAGWCFPRGKINSEESEAACAIREVEEETGFDMSDYIDPNAFIKTQVNAQDITMFLVLGIDESTVFETQTRKEIGAIEWVPLVDLPVWTNKKGPRRTGGKAQKRFYNVTPFVGGIKKFLAKNGISTRQAPRKERNERSGRQQGGGGNNGRDLQPFAFDSAQPQGGRELQPFSFGGESTPKHTGTPSTAIDHLFAKFIQKDDNAVALESSTARTMDQLFCAVEPAHSTADEAQDKNDDDVLARLLGNIGTVSDEPPAPTLPPPEDKQSKLLSVLHMKPAAVAAQPASPQHSSHQHNLLSMLASPPKADGPAIAPHEDDRANRQRALLESTIMGYTPSPSGSMQALPMHGASPLPHHPANVSPMPQHPGSQPPPSWSPYPQSHTPGSVQGHAPPPVPRSRPQQPPSQPQPPQMLQHPSQQHIPEHAQYPGPNGPHHSPVPQPPRTDHQRALLGTLFSGAKQSPGHFGGGPMNGPPAGYPGPAMGAGPPHGGPGMAPGGPRGPPPNGQLMRDGPPAQQYSGSPYGQPLPPQHTLPSQVMGHQRQLSGGLPGQPGQGRPIGGGAGLPGQPGQPGQLGQLGGWTMPPGIAPPPMPYASPQGFPMQPPGPPGHMQGQPGQLHPAQQHLQQMQQQHAQMLMPQQQQQQPPVRTAQTPPATMHQPVARPPVSGSLLGLAAGR